MPKDNWMVRFTEELDLPGEPVQPLVEIIGDCRCLIENHRGVTQYGREKICVKVKFGQIAVQGCGLEIARMSKAQLIISGRIEGVTMQRRVKK